MKWRTYVCRWYETERLWRHGWCARLVRWGTGSNLPHNVAIFKWFPVMGISCKIENETWHNNLSWSLPSMKQNKKSKRARIGFIQALSIPIESAQAKQALAKNMDNFERCCLFGIFCVSIKEQIFEWCDWMENKFRTFLCHHSSKTLRYIAGKSSEIFTSL